MIIKHYPHVGDLGTAITVVMRDQDDVLDISTASPKKIIMRRPNGSVIEKDGILSTDGKDGSMYFLTISGDFSVAGEYQVQGEVDIDGNHWSGEISKFDVLPNLN